jgi:hypothetical protein
MKTITFVLHRSYSQAGYQLRLNPMLSQIVVLTQNNWINIMLPIEHLHTTFGVFISMVGAAPMRIADAEGFPTYSTSAPVWKALVGTGVFVEVSE